jgi:hypothetical protein
MGEKRKTFRLLARKKEATRKTIRGWEDNIKMDNDAVVGTGFV